MVMSKKTNKKTHDSKIDVMILSGEASVHWGQEKTRRKKRGYKHTLIIYPASNPRNTAD